jgi:DNA helicase-2/ATP-dependent DNA helicase PcrA
VSEEKKLNKQQLEAVNHGTGPLLIIAGAGTGKTTVITERVKRLIADKLAEPSQILALTFTEKAAREMEERIDQALPYGYTQMWVMTFHSFCDRVLRDEGLHIGINSGYKLLTDTGAVSLIRRHLFELPLDYFRPLGNPNKFISGLLQHFDRLRDEDINPNQYLSWVKKTYPKNDSEEAGQYYELSNTFINFQNLKHQEAALDFADLIVYTLQLFRNRPHILKKYQDQFKYILVDEFQDTNYAQNQLVSLLAGEPANLTVVADDDQSIYRWRGAAVSNVIQFRQAFPQAKLVVLTQNYRSTQAILDTAYQLIQHNNPDRLEVKAKIAKQLKSVSKKPGAPPEFLHFDRLENEADGVAKKINELLSDEKNGLSPKDFAILVRANAHAHPFSAALSRHGVASQFLGPGRLFDQPEIKDLIAFLRVMKDPTDSASLFRVLSMDFFAIPVRDLISVSNFAQRQNRSLLEVCEELKSNPQITKLVDLINTHLRQSLKESAGQVLFNFLNSSGLLAAILNYQLPIDERIAQNITRFFSKLKSFESENSDATIPAVLDWIDLSHEVGESPAATDTDWSEMDAVNILTLHSAKGLEFPVVFLVNLVVGRFPSLERKEQIPVPDELIKEVLPQGDFHLQEERRLFYVGLTRAKHQLFLTAADYYGEGKRVKKLSPFISEALGNNVTMPQFNIATVQPSLLDWQPPQFSTKKITNHEPITINYLSYSQIQTFIDCPLHYKAKYILRLPSPPSAASSFGNTIHKTMKDYYQSIKRNEHPDILQIFSRAWTPEGYYNSRHAKEYFDRGHRYLAEFITANPFPHSPAVLEESFTVPIGDIKIGGKIDRADILPDGTLEIIDYKTSTKLLDAAAAAKDLQLSFYALAATLIPHPPFNRQPGQVKLTLYYFDRQQAVSVFQTPQQLAAAKSEIIDYAKQIQDSDFHCSGSLICQKQCDFQILCDIDRPNSR